MRSVARPMLHIGMLLAGLAYAGWWAQHTIFDPSRTQRLAHAVLDDARFRDYLAAQVEPALGKAIPAVGHETAAQRATSDVTSRLSDAMARADIRTDLETFVGDAHRHLIGDGRGVVEVPASTIQAMAGAAVPTLTPADLAKIHAVNVDIPHISLLQTVRTTISDWLALVVAAAVLLVGMSLVIARNRKGELKIIGRWLIGLSLVHVLVMWVIPVIVVPRLSTSPWARLLSEAARALGAGLITALVVMLVAGVALMFAESLLPDTARHQRDLQTPGTGY